MDLKKEVGIDLTDNITTYADIMLMKQISPNTFEAYHVEIKNSATSPFTINQLSYYYQTYVGKTDFTANGVIMTNNGISVDKPIIKIKGSVYIEGNGIDLKTYTINLPK
jgi:hypothetical protein